jgi:hypothetical protein
MQDTVSFTPAFWLASVSLTCFALNCQADCLLALVMSWTREPSDPADMQVARFGSAAEKAFGE